MKKFFIRETYLFLRKLSMMKRMIIFLIAAWIIIFIVLFISMMLPIG